MSQKELISKFSFEYKTLISKSTMSDVLKPDYERKLNQLESVENYNKRVRDAKYPELEKCLYLWNCEMLSKNLP